MTKINDGGHAFPQFDHGNWGVGMSLRDYFAGQALSAMGPSWFGGADANLAASRAYHVADAMLAAREADPS